MIQQEILHFHVCGGAGGGAKGFNRGQARVGHVVAKPRCIGAVDVDAAGIADFDRVSGSKGTVIDLFTREQYVAFHERQPPAGWREATPQDFQRAAHGERPHVVFMSTPCKGFSGLLSDKLSTSAKYQALNGLTLRAVWLTLEAWQDDPPEFILFENVPRIATRGRWLLDQIGALLSAYGYVFAETTHDCGVLGGLAQSRKRFLLVARHAQKVPPFLYEPEKKRLRGVGEVLDKLPLPGDPIAGPMHRVPSLQWKTWVRLAFVEAGSDWRSLNRLRVADGILQDFAIEPDAGWHRGVLGVRRWEETVGTVTGRGSPTTGTFAVADPRPARNGAHGVIAWDEASGAVQGESLPSNGKFSVADPRCTWASTAHRNKLKVVEYEGPAGTVTGADRVGSGALCVADPRPHGLNAEGRDVYRTGGHYGVTPWDEPAGAIPGFAKNNNGPWSVADPRPAEGDETETLPKPDDRLVAVIRALDGTWHRPFTTFELGAIQSYFDPDDIGFVMAGSSDSAWRERIGNMVPPDSATAIMGVIARTLLLAKAGETFMLSSEPIWVQPVAIALSIDIPMPAAE
ncbi:MAG: DNA cytosine methyltransferase [Reyranella sp.]|nr:DNA cytosine methyltransferase [Reyranella sp.]